MTHKEKCSVMKQMRKKIADKLGIDLHQTECTFQGECNGTCPKCAHEENILNKAILGSTIVASSLALCACDLTSTPQVDRTEREEFSTSKEKKNNNSGDDITTGGDVQYNPEEYEGGIVLEGEPEYDPDEVEALAGDVAIEAYTYDSLCQAASEYTGAPVCEVDSEDDMEGTVTIHCYEIVDNGEDDVHTATVDWLTISVYTGIGTNLLGEEVDLTPYL